MPIATETGEMGQIPFPFLCETMQTGSILYQIAWILFLKPLGNLKLGTSVRSRVKSEEFMRRGSVIPLCLVLAVAIGMYVEPAACAEDEKGIRSHIAIAVGLEELGYEEHEPDSNLDSSATTYNLVLGIEALKSWEYVFCGIRTVVPVLRGDDEEHWTLAGGSYQTDALEYGWLRIDGYAGYPLSRFLNPYFGLRWSESKQERTDFVVLGTPVVRTATETVKARYLLLGATGGVGSGPRWVCTYALEFFIPIYVRVANDALPGWEATDRDGYIVELKGGIEYSYNRDLSFALVIYGGRMHWNGSGWKPYGGGTAKWPENDTDYFGGMARISWTF